MKTRRGFFQSLAKAAAIIALAPQIAFRVKPEEVVVQRAATFWFEIERDTLCVDEAYMKFMSQYAAKCFYFPPSFQDFVLEHDFKLQQSPSPPPSSSPSEESLT